MKTLAYVFVRKNEILKGAFTLEPPGTKDADLGLKKLGDPDGGTGEAPSPEQPSVEEIHWCPDYSSAREWARDSKRPLCLFIRAKRSVSLPNMEATTLHNPEIIKILNQHFVPVKLDSATNPALIEAIGVSTFPTTVLASPDGKILLKREGYLDAPSLRRKLRAAQERIAKASVGDVESITINDRKMKIPVQVDKLATAKLQRLHLLVSADEGQSWRRACSITPDQSAFTFQATHDGLYWFVVQTQTEDGKIEPAKIDESLRPSLKVYIDTELKNVQDHWLLP